MVEIFETRFRSVFASPFFQKRNFKLEAYTTASPMALYMYTVVRDPGVN